MHSMHTYCIHIHSTHKYSFKCNIHICMHNARVQYVSVQYNRMCSMYKPLLTLLYKKNYVNMYIIITFNIAHEITILHQESTNNMALKRKSKAPKIDKTVRQTRKEEMRTIMSI